LQVIFRKRATNYRALLRKMTYKDKASYGFSPTCMRQMLVSYGDKNIRLYNIVCENYRSPLQKSPNYRSLLQKSPNYRSLLQKSPIGLYCTRALSNSRQYSIVCV